MSDMRLFHSLAQAQRSHVSPNFLDVFETRGFTATLAGITPPKRVITISGPDRVLIFVVDDGFIDSRVFCFRVVQTHLVASYLCLRDAFGQRFKGYKRNEKMMSVVPRKPS